MLYELICRLVTTCSLSSVGRWYPNNPPDQESGQVGKGSKNTSGASGVEKWFGPTHRSLRSLGHTLQSTAIICESAASNLPKSASAARVTAKALNSPVASGRVLCKRTHLQSSVSLSEVLRSQLFSSLHHSGQPMHKFELNFY